MFHVHCRESSRVVFVPFDKPRENSETVDDINLITALRGAGDAVPLFINLGQQFVSSDSCRSEIDRRIVEVFKDVQVTSRVRRTYTILLSFVLKVYPTTV